MANEVKADVTVTSPILYSGGSGTNSLPQFSYLGSHIVKAHLGVLYVLVWRANSTPLWIEVKHEDK